MNNGAFHSHMWTHFMNPVKSPVVSLLLGQYCAATKSEELALPLESKVVQFPER